MRILYIHTYYQFRGGEDAVFEKERSLMAANNCIVNSVIFSNRKLSGLKFILAPFNLFSFFKVYRKLVAFKPDIVHMHNWSFAASPSVIWAVKLRKIPIVHTLHNFRIICPSASLTYNQQVFFESIHSFFPWKSIRKAVFRNSILSTFWLLITTRFNFLIGSWRKIDCFISLTGSGKTIFERSFLKIPAEKIVLKPNFVDDTFFKNTIQRENHFLYVGRLSEEKGIKILLEAFAGTSHCLRIIGDGSLRQLVETYAGSYPTISYLGYQEKEKVMEEMRHCTALLFPSVCIESFGMTVIEAFSTGTPVIASDIGSAKDLITEGVNGLHFSCGSIPDLQNKLQNWFRLSNYDKNIFSKNSYTTFKKHFTPEINFKKLYSIYEDVIKNKTIR